MCHHFENAYPQSVTLAIFLLQFCDVITDWQDERILLNPRPGEPRSSLFRLVYT